MANLDARYGRRVSRLSKLAYGTTACGALGLAGASVTTNTVAGLEIRTMNKTQQGIALLGGFLVAILLLVADWTDDSMSTSRHVMLSAVVVILLFCWLAHVFNDWEDA